MSCKYIVLEVIKSFCKLRRVISDHFHTYQNVVIWFSEGIGLNLY